MFKSVGTSIPKDRAGSEIAASSCAPKLPMVCQKPERRSLLGSRNEQCRCVEHPKFQGNPAERAACSLMPRSAAMLPLWERTFTASGELSWASCLQPDACSCTLIQVSFTLFMYNIQSYRYNLLRLALNSGRTLLGELVTAHWRAVS